MQPEKQGSLQEEKARLIRDHFRANWLTARKKTLRNQSFLW